MPSESRCSLGFEIAVGTFATAILLLCIAFVLWFKRSGRPPGPDDTFCCPSLVRILWEASNTTLDPCRDFYGYTCHNWDKSEEFSRLRTFLLHEVEIPTYTLSRHKSLAAYTIARFYRQCLVAFSGDDLGLREAVKAPLTTIRPPLSPTPKEMLDLLLHVVLLYEMPFALAIDDVDSYVSMGFSEKNVEAWTSHENVFYRKLGLSAFNEVTSSNVSWEDLKQLRVAGSAKVRKIRRSSYASLLSGILPDIGHEDWEKAWWKYKGKKIPRLLYHPDVDTLKQFFSAVLKGAQPTALAFLFVEAGERYWEHFRTEQEMGESGGRYSYAEGLDMLWDIVVVETFSSKRKDDIVRKIYTAICDQIVLHCSSLFPADDVKVVHEISSVQLLLPWDMHLDEIDPPVSTTDYWTKDLALKEYVRDVRRHQRNLGMPPYVYGLFLYGQTRQYWSPPSVIVSPLYYALLNFSGASEALVNMAVVGTQLAFLWNMVLNNATAFSPATAEAIQEFKDCVSNNDSQGILRLKMETVVNASRSSTWHRMVYSWGTQMISRSRVFYASYVLNNVCAGHYGGLLGPARGTVELMGGAPDFLEAFRCPSLPGAATGYCRLLSSK